MLETSSRGRATMVITLKDIIELAKGLPEESF
jgi:hypothetical protein